MISRILTASRWLLLTLILLGGLHASAQSYGPTYCTEDLAELGGCEEGQMLCGYTHGYRVSGINPPCPTVAEAFSNPIYGGSQQCAEPGNLLPVCIQDRWFWVDTDSVPPEEGEDVTATLVANPDTILAGGESQLTWSSTNATSCTGLGFSTGGATSGSVYVSPAVTTAYVVTCTDGVSSGSSLEWNVEVEDDISDIFCPSGSIKSGSANDTNVYSGIPTCAASNPAGTACSVSGNSCKRNAWYAPGDPLNCWVVTDLYTCSGTGVGSDSVIHTASDSATVTVVPALAASCTVSPLTLEAGEPATWTASASGGESAYEYEWSGTDGLSGTSASVTKSYASPGIKTASVQVESGGQSVTVTCNNSLTVTESDLPNLTAGNIPGGSATPGTPKTLTSAIANTGIVPVGITTYTLFQKAKSAAGASATSMGYGSTNAVSAGGSSSSSYSATFSESDKPVYVRACADAGQTGSGPDIRDTDGLVVESDAGAYNCSSWIHVHMPGDCEPGDANYPNCDEDCQPGDPGYPNCDEDCEPGDPGYPTSCEEGDGLSCTDNDADNRVTVGGTVRFTANPSGDAAGPYEWTDGLGNELGTGLTLDRLFTEENNNVGTRVEGSNTNLASCSAIDVIGADGCTEGSVSVFADPDRVKKFDRSEITWDVSSVATPGNGPECTLKSSADSTWNKNIEIPLNKCTTGDGGTFTTHPITGQTTFTLKCGSKTATAVVNIFPVIDEF